MPVEISQLDIEMIASLPTHIVFQYEEFRRPLVWPRGVSSPTTSRKNTVSQVNQHELKSSSFLCYLEVSSWTHLVTYYRRIQPQAILWVSDEKSPSGRGRHWGNTCSMSKPVPFMGTLSLLCTYVLFHCCMLPCSSLRFGASVLTVKKDGA